MSFHASAENIRVDDGHILRASVNGQDAELDLNSCLGNNNGRFEWGGRGKLLTSSHFLSIFSPLPHRI